MRHTLTLAMLFGVQLALAVDSVPIVLYEGKGTRGERVQFRSDTRTLWDLPVWTPGGEDPPISLSAATKIAMETALRQSPKAAGVSFGDIKLLKGDFDFSSGKVVSWFWVFSVAPSGDAPDGTPTLEPFRDIVILLDGTVVEGTPPK